MFRAFISRDAFISMVGKELRYYSHEIQLRDTRRFTGSAKNKLLNHKCRFVQPSDIPIHMQHFYNF